MRKISSEISSLPSKKNLGINYFITRGTQETSVSVIMTPSLALNL